MNDKVKAFALATGLLASPIVDARHGGYGGYYDGYGGYNGGYSNNYYTPRPITKSLNTSTCIGYDRVAMKSTVVVEDYASGSAQNSYDAISAVRNGLEYEWNNTVRSTPPEMLMDNFQWAAQNVANNVSAQYGANVQIYPQGVNVVQGGCSNGNYYQQPHHHRGWGGW